MLVYYGVVTFYPPPKYEAIITAVAVPQPNGTPEERREYQEQRQKQQEQQQAYRAAAKDFAKVLLVVGAPVGVAAILIGAYLALHSIGTGLIFGGIFTVTLGYWNYWQYLDDWIRFVSLLAGFAILIFVGYRRIGGGRATSIVT